MHVCVTTFAPHCYESSSSGFLSMLAKSSISDGKSLILTLDLRSNSWDTVNIRPSMIHGVGVGGVGVGVGVSVSVGGERVTKKQKTKQSKQQTTTKLGNDQSPSTLGATMIFILSPCK